LAKIKINLGGVKKHAAPIACGVVALAAVIAGFFPLGGYKQELQASLNKSLGTKSAIDGMLSRSRNLPSVNPDVTEAKTLEKFPSASIIKSGNELVERVKAQTTGLLDEVVKRNAHALLVPNSLPFASQGQKLTFRDRYKVAIEQDIPEKILNAGIPPAGTDLQLALDEESKRIVAQESIVVNGQVINQLDVQNKVALRRSQLPQEKREAVARTHKIYLGSAANGGLTLPVYDALWIAPNILNQAAIPDEASIWFAQLGLWIEEDVAQSLADINKNAKSVIDAPVKHLLKLTWKGEYILGAPAGTATGADPAAPITPMKQMSPTGRVCCQMYDVVQYELRMRVAADKLPQVLDELGRNRLITVLKVDVNAFDSAAAAVGGYFYGEDPVVEVTVQCEELFLRKWTVPFMPDLIKKYLGIPDAPPVAAG